MTTHSYHDLAFFCESHLQPLSPITPFDHASKIVMVAFDIVLSGLEQFDRLSKPPKDGRSDAVQLCICKLTAYTVAAPLSEGQNVRFEPRGLNGVKPPLRDEVIWVREDPVSALNEESGHSHGRACWDDVVGVDHRFVEDSREP
jgi:hypothetical protein